MGKGVVRVGGIGGCGVEWGQLSVGGRVAADIDVALESDYYGECVGVGASVSLEEV
jgi:hypothetical protein